MPDDALVEISGLHAGYDDIAKEIILLDSPGKHWLLVEPRDRKKLAASLQELGFRVGHELPSQRSTATGTGGELDQGG